MWRMLYVIIMAVLLFVLNVPHYILQQWSSKVFPGTLGVAAAVESGIPVVIANCTGSMKYSPEIDTQLITHVKLSGYGARISGPLSHNWLPAHKTLIWETEEPKLIVIHLACFHRGGKTDAAYAERTAYFVAFLETFKEDTVKVLVYSHAFANKPRFVELYIPRLLAQAYGLE